MKVKACLKSRHCRDGDIAGMETLQVKGTLAPLPPRRPAPFASSERPPFLVKLNAQTERIAHLMTFLYLRHSTEQLVLLLASVAVELQPLPCWWPMGSFATAKVEAGVAPLLLCSEQEIGFWVLLERRLPRFWTLRNRGEKKTRHLARAWLQDVGGASTHV
jgi:hypothetical protein